MDFSRIRHLVFDFDGTLGDSYGPIAESFNHMLGAFGRGPVTVEEVRPWVGIGLEFAIKHYLGEEAIPRCLELFREHYERVFLGGTCLMVGVVGMLERLEGRFRMALTSNKPGDTLRRLLPHLGVERYFDVVLGAYDVEHLKPHPAMLEEALRRLGATNGDTLYVGDTLTDVQFARSCGVPFVLTLGGSGTREELMAEDPVALLADVTRLPDLLDGAPIPGERQGSGG